MYETGDRKENAVLWTDVFQGTCIKLYIYIFETIL